MCIIGKVSNVTITATTATTVTFTTDSKLVSATNNSPLEDRRLVGEYTVQVPGDIWETDAVETTDHIPIDKHVERKVGATGPIYLQSAALRQIGTSARGNCVIRGSQGPETSSHTTPTLHDEDPIPLKWPDCGGPEKYDVFELKPTGVQIVCMSLRGKPRRVKLDLFDHDIATLAQTFEMSGQEIKLRLTKQGASMLGLNDYELGQPVAVFPLRVEITGAMADGSGHVGVVDLRNSAEADPIQRLSWQKPGDKVAVQLSVLGAGARFGVFSNAITKAVDTLTGDLALQNDVRTLWSAAGSLDALSARGLDLADSPANRRAKALIERLRG